MLELLNQFTSEQENQNVTIKQKLNDFKKDSSLFKAYQNHDNFVARVEKLEKSIPEYEQKMSEL